MLTCSPTSVPWHKAPPPFVRVAIGNGDWDGDTRSIFVKNFKIAFSFGRVFSFVKNSEDSASNSIKNKKMDSDKQS